MGIDDTPQLYHGRCLSSGLADGPLVVQTSNDVVDTPSEDHQVDAEHEHSILDQAVEKITCDLVDLASQVERDLSAPLGRVFDAHRLIANDDSLRTEMRREITENLVSAGAAVRIVFGRWEERFHRMESTLARSKGDDMADISQRLHQALNEVFHHSLATIPPGCILVRNRLLPSDTIFMTDHLPAGIVLAHGSQGSHAALFVRDMGIPCVVGCRGLHVWSTAPVRALVDADLGTVWLSPDVAAVADFERKQRSLASARQQDQQQAQTPALTLDGTPIHVLANVGSATDARRAIDNGADGIGLFRLEQIYLGCLTPPGVDELMATIRPILQPFRGKPICIRLLDAGGDKQLPFLGVQAETNPALGLRGIRLLRAYPHLLDTSLRALIELAQEFSLSILIPLVTVPEDIATVTAAVDTICRENDCRRPPIGAMIETPAAALMLDTLQAQLDFVCFGTNDLTQYCFAADRDSSAVEQYFLDGHPAIFRLLRFALQAAPDLPATVCGALASDTRYTDALITLGLRSLSVAPPTVAAVKQAVRRTPQKVATIAESGREPTRQAIVDPPAASLVAART